MPQSIRTRVAIVGAGPAGLILSHLLAEEGIESVVIDRRTRAEIESTIRAGILEQGTVELLARIDPGTRVQTVGERHDGIELRFQGEGHRIDFRALVGRSVWLYPQHEVLTDLLALRADAGQDLRFGVTASGIDDTDPDRPRVIATDSHGDDVVIDADFVVGADGSRSVVRSAVAGASGNGVFREYPFAWFGILCDAPPSSDELLYSNSDDGFALISQRSPQVQRMYFQCDPGMDAQAPSEAEIWATLQPRVPGTSLKRGPIFQRDVLRFRSFVAGELRRGPLALVGDAAHTVPPPPPRREGHEPGGRRRGTPRAGAARAVAGRRLPAHRHLLRARTATHLESTALLVVDDQHAPHPASRGRLRPVSPDRRATVCGRVRGRTRVPGGGLHRVAARRLTGTRRRQSDSAAVRARSRSRAAASAR